jgi:hypothetical protein
MHIRLEPIKNKLHTLPYQHSMDLFFHRSNIFQLLNKTRITYKLLDDIRKLIDKRN